jgi:hypothetical protein
MPRYFFNLESENVEVVDSKGREFACADEACRYAQMVVRRTETHLDDDDGRWLIRIKNPQDDCEFIVLFHHGRERKVKTRSSPGSRTMIYSLESFGGG